jgi:hypothetical protein
MPKQTHRNVKFTKEEMEYDIPDNLDLGKLRYVGRGQKAMEMARRISRARGAEKRRLIESLPRCDDEPSTVNASVQLEPDVASIFKDGAAVNKALRALIQAMPAIEPVKRRKIA